MSKKFNLLQTAGVALILLSCLLLIGSEFLTARRQNTARELAAQIQSSLPAPVEGNPSDYSDPAMPILQIDGTDFSCLVEIPSFGVTLPVASQWDSSRVPHYPCRFWGSAYDNSLIIGGSGRKGQFDFCGRVDLGHKITLTDMAGSRFAYEVARIDRRKDADAATLQDEAWDLTLFMRDAATMDYIIVRCRFTGGI